MTRTPARSYSQKRQHFVPRSYLAAWCDPECPPDRTPYVWTFPRDGGPPKARSPEKLFRETDIYTIHVPGSGSGRDLRLEHGLQTLEDWFLRVRETYVEPRKRLPPVAMGKLLAFTAALQWRTPTARDHLRAQWRPALELMDEIAEKAKTWTPAQKEAAGGMVGGSGPTFSHDQVRRMVTSPLQTSMPGMIDGVTRALSQMSPTIVCTDASAPFITSDHPCGMFDPEAHKRPPLYQGVGLGWPDVELTLPLSPTRLLLVTHKPLDPFVDAPAWLVADINRRTCRLATDTIVTAKPEFDQFWTWKGDELNPGPSA